MTPSSSGQAMAIRRAYEGAGYTPADLDFVEGHGTGTRVGDQIELKGVFEAQSSGEVPPAARRTGMTSLKSIVGHTKAAAGIGAFIKTTMAVNRRVLPPTGSCKDPNPVFKDTCHSLYPLVHGRVADPSSTMRAGVSAMGFGGINSHVTLESPAAPSEKFAPQIDEGALLASNQTSEVFVFTAATYEQLTVEVTHLMETAKLVSCGDLIDLSAELALRASNQQPIRAAVIANTTAELVEGLNSLKTLMASYPPAHGEVTWSWKRDVWLSNKCDQSRIGFLFPGQSSQQLVMARKLVARYGWAREMVAAADRVQMAAGLPTVSETVFADVQRAIDRDTQTALRKNLARTEIAQVAIVTASAIYARYLETMGIKPVVCGGHSLGELTALYQSGAFDFDTLLQIVSLRGRAMASPAEQAGAMAALFCSREMAESMIGEVGGYVVLANVNSPKQVVVSGDEQAVAAVMAKCNEQGIRAARLNVSNAFHSKYVSSAAETMRQQAPIPMHAQRMDIDVFSCMTGQHLASNVDLKDHLSRQIVESVDFVSMVESMESQCDMLIEVGPNKVLSKLTDDILTWSSVSCSPTASHPDVDCDMNSVLAKTFVYGVDVQWNRLFESRLARPFVPASERKFIGNPCENPFAELGEVKQLSIGNAGGVQPMEPADSMDSESYKDAISQMPAEPIADASDIPPSVPMAQSPAEAPSAPMQSQTPASSLPESIASRFSTPTPSSHEAHEPTHETAEPTNRISAHVEQPTETHHTTLSEDFTLPEPTPTADTNAGTMQAANTPETTPMQSPANDHVADTIINVIHERTGFPKETLTLDLRLLDDLNLDSIKAGDVIATAARELGALGPIDPASLADATIGDIIVVVKQAMGEDTSAQVIDSHATPTPAMPGSGSGCGSSSQRQCQAKQCQAKQRQAKQWPRSTCPLLQHKCTRSLPLPRPLQCLEARCTQLLCTQQLHR